MILVDTSAWIQFFKDSNLRDLFTADEIGICLPIYQEVLQGVRNEKTYREIKEILDAAVFFDAPLPKERFIEAAEIYRLGRKTGKTIRSATDCLIAAIAIQHNVIVVHRDRDYEAISEFTELKQRII